MIDMKSMKEALTDDQVTKVVMALGSAEPHMEGNGHLRFQTVCHHGDGFNLCYYPDSKSFHCYTHCKENFDVFELVKRSRGFDSNGEAIRWIADLLGFDPGDHQMEEEVELETSDEWDLFDKKRAYDEAAARKPEPAPEISEGLLNVFGPPVAPEEWVADGISPEVMARYGIRVDSAKSQIIIPHRDVTGKLIGIRCRNFDEEAIAEGGKYMPAMINGVLYAHPLGRHLFGLWQNKDLIRSSRKVLICESEKSVMQCATIYGIDRNFCVATCGHSISFAQVRLLLDLGVTEMILGYDHDVDLHVDLNGNKNKETQEFEQELLDIVRPYTQYFGVEIIVDYDNILGHKDSPTDDGREKLETLMRKKIRIPAIAADPNKFRKFAKENK